MLRGETLQSFYNLGYALLVLALLAWLLFNILAPAYIEDQFFTNPSFFAALIGAKYYLIFSAFLTFLVAAILYGFLEFVRYRQLLYFLTQPYVLLEVRLPETKEYSISFMEALFESLSLGYDESNWYMKWIQGKTRPIYSFEIVSDGGVVRFFIRVRSNMRDVVSTSVYTYYPDAQITESDDYTLDVVYDMDKLRLFGVEWNLEKPDGLTIKSYTEFDAAKVDLSKKDSVVKSNQIDPISPLFEVAGSLTGSERLWLQFVMRTEKYPYSPKEYETLIFNREYWDKKKLSEEALAEIEALRKKHIEQTKLSEVGIRPEVTDAEKRLFSIAGRIGDKGVFEVGMRMLYIAPKEEFKNNRIPSMLNSFRLTSTATNRLVPSARLFESSTVFPEKVEREGKIRERTILLQLYRDRMFWFAPAIYRYSPKSEDIPTVVRKTMRMSTEILATICHFPTVFIQTPTVQRTLARTGESPINLPT